MQHSKEAFLYSRHIIGSVVYFLFFLLVSPNFALGQCGNLYFEGAIDGPLSGGTPKAIQLCASGNIADLSIYGFESTSNANASLGTQEFTFPADALSSGDCIWVSNNSTTQFSAWFGFNSCYSSGQVNSNGDDSYILYCSGAVVDMMGQSGTDGSGQPWEYLDGWINASDAVANPVFDATEWNYSTPNALDGESDNGTASNPYPNTNVNCPGLVCDAFLTIGTATCDANTAGADTYTATFNFTDSDATGSYTVSITNSNGTLSSTSIVNAASATITVTGATEGTPVIVNISDGVVCDVTETISSPICNPPATFACAGGGSLIMGQGFEDPYTSQTGWTYTSSIGTCTVGTDIWDLQTGTLGNISASIGSGFWGIQDLQSANCSPVGTETLTFSTITIPAGATYTSVEVCYDIYNQLFDATDNMGASITVDGCEEVSGNIFTGNGSEVPWTKYCNIVPVMPGSTVDLIISVTQNGGTDYGGIDNVTICESSSMAMTACVPLEPLTCPTGQTLIAGQDFDITNTWTYTAYPDPWQNAAGSDFWGIGSSQGSVSSCAGDAWVIEDIQAAGSPANSTPGDPSLVLPGTNTTSPGGSVMDGEGYLIFDDITIGTGVTSVDLTVTISNSVGWDAGDDITLTPFINGTAGCRWRFGWDGIIHCKQCRW